MTGQSKSVVRIDRLARWLGIITTVAYSLGWLAPYYWFFDLFRHFIFYYALALLFCGLSFAYAGKIKSLIATSVVGAVMMFELYDVQNPARSVEASSSLRVTHFNVRALNSNHQQIIRQTLRPDVDLALFLEIGPEWEESFRHLPAPWRLEIFSPTKDNFGIALISRSLLLKKRVLFMGPFSLPAVEAELELDGQPILFLGIHAAPPISAEFAHARDVQFEQLVDRVKTSTRPAIIVGDFNATPWSHSLRRLQSNASLQSAYELYSPTWPAGGMVQIPIDLSLYSQPLVVLEREVGGAIGSDHKLVEVTFAIPKAEAR